MEVKRSWGLERFKAFLEVSQEGFEVRVDAGNDERTKAPNIRKVSNRTNSVK
jgi:hypothetical protein